MGDNNDHAEACLTNWSTSPAWAESSSGPCHARTCLVLCYASSLRGPRRDFRSQQLTPAWVESSSGPWRARTCRILCYTSSLHGSEGVSCLAKSSTSPAWVESSSGPCRARTCLIVCYTSSLHGSVPSEKKYTHIAEAREPRPPS